MNLTELKKIAEEAIEPRLDDEIALRCYEIFQEAIEPGHVITIITNYEKAVEALKAAVEHDEEFWGRRGRSEAEQTLKELGEI